MTRDPLPQDEDKRLELLFRAAAEPVADAGFSDAVMNRLAGQVWRRRLVLAAAGTVGAAVAFKPVWALSITFGQQLEHLGGLWTVATSLLHNPMPVMVGLAVLAIAGPGIAQWLEE